MTRAIEHCDDTVMEQCDEKNSPVALDLLLHDDVNKLDQFGPLCVGVIGSLFMGHSEIVCLLYRIASI